MTASYPQLNLKWLTHQASQHKPALIKANLIALFATALSVPIPLLMPLLVDEVLLSQPARGIAALNQLLPSAWQQPTAYIVSVLVITVILRIFSQVLNILQTRQFSLLSKKISYQLRAMLLGKLGQISMQQHESLGSGSLSANLITDVNSIDSFISSSLSRFVVSLLSVLGIAIVLLWINWQLALFILLLNPFVIYLSRRLGKRVQTLKKNENQAVADFQQRLVDVIDSLYQLRVANREQHYFSLLKQDAATIRHSADHYTWQADAANRLSFLCFLIGFDIFRAAAMAMVLMSDLSIGQIFAIFGYLWFMLGPIQDLLGIQYAWYAAKAAMQRLDKVLHLSEQANRSPIEKASKTTANNKGCMQVELRNLNFAYDDDRQILNKLSLKLPPGKKVALVGASGAGKSSLIQVLLGIYPKQSGDILINGQPIETLTYAALRQQVAIVLQQPMLFNASLRENLSLGLNINDERLWQVLEQAQLSELKNQLSQGLDSLIGRNGIKLSGGQRQRIAIARMMLSSPSLVIMDEATSALDNTTEIKVQQALQTFLKDRTTLIVAHRLSAVKDADLIYVIDNGQVVQSGNHQQLLGEKGAYQMLYGQLSFN